jgi:hypothetical protein
MTGSNKKGYVRLQISEITEMNSNLLPRQNILNPRFLVDKPHL